MPIWGELVLSGKRELGVHALEKPTVVIGRSSKADVKIQHHQISAQHCQMVCDEVTRRVVVVDKSSNGTLLRIKGVSKKMSKNTEYEINDCDCIILVKTAEKNDEIWYEFRRVPSATNVENIGPVSVIETQTKPQPPPVVLSSTGQGDTSRVNNETIRSPIEEGRDATLPLAQRLSISKTTLADPSIANETKLTSSNTNLSMERNNSFDDSIDADLPDFDDVLKPYAAYVSTVVPEKKVESLPPVALKILQFPAKRAASSDKSSPSSGPSAAKKSAPVTVKAIGSSSSIASSSSTNTATTSAPYVITRVTTSHPTSSTSCGVNLDDSDDLPDLIPDFKAPASVAELRARPLPTIAPTVTKTSSATAPVAMSAAERARKLMASALPADFLSDGPSTSQTETDAPAPSSEQSAKPTTSSSGNIEENLICTICQEIFHEPINVTPCNHVFCAGCLSMWLDKGSKECPQCRTHVASCAEHHLLKSLVDAFLSSNPDRKRTPEELAELDKHNTITRNKKKQSPGRGRGGGQTANRGGYGGFGGFQPPGGNYSDSDSDSYMYDDDSDDSDDGSGFNFPFANLLQSMTMAINNAVRGRGAGRGARGARGGRGRGAASTLAPRGGSHATGASNVAPWGLVCRQCPGGALAGGTASNNPAPTRGGARGGRRRGASNATTSSASASSSAGPSTSTPTPSINGTILPPSLIPPYTCTSNSHLSCRCCAESFPAREGQAGVPALRCNLCHGSFCHLYWGCRGASCTGCLGTLNAFVTTAHELEGGIAIQTNTVEAGFFAEYLNSHSVTPQTVLDLGFQLMELNAMPELNGITPQSIVCRLCFKNKVIPAVAYAYRAQLTSSDLPPAVANRPNCEWGKDCRTQKRSVPHSRKHNHICQPTGNHAAGTSH